MADVFISYARDDAGFVRGLAEAVAREGYSVWWDDALPPHLSYSEVITGEIAAAKAAIVVWSEKAIASEWVRAEADVARNQKKLVQTSIDGRIPPMPFNQLHFVSIGDWRGEGDHPGWMRVKESLAALCRGAVSQPAYAFPTTAPPRPAPTPSSGNPAPRLALLVLVGLLLLGGAGGTAFWLVGGGSAPAVVESQPPASQGAPPTLSAPASPAQSKAPAPRPSAPLQTTPRPATAPVRIGPDKPQTAPVRQAQTPPMNLRRYCSGPGRGTPRCRQFRTQVARPGTATAD